MKRKWKIWVSLIVIMGLFWIGKVEAGGIGTNFGKVIVKNLEVGKTYSISKLSKFLLTVKNNSEGPTGLEIEILKPSPDDKRLIEGREPIPDTSWISLEKYAFNIPPGEEITTDVIVSIPENEAYRGKKYLVYILSRTTKGMIRLALQGRMTLEIAEDESKAGLSSKGLVDERMNFLVEPGRFLAQEVKVGERYSIKELAGRPFRITNMSDRRYGRLWAWVEKILRFFHIRVGEIGRKYTISSIPVPEYLLKEGYEPLPEASFLKFKCVKKLWFRRPEIEYKSRVNVKINGKTSREIEGYIEFPEGDEYKSKKYIVAIQIESGGAKRYVRGFVEMAK